MTLVVVLVRVPIFADHQLNVECAQTITVAIDISSNISTDDSFKAFGTMKSTWNLLEIHLRAPCESSLNKTIGKFPTSSRTIPMEFK